MRRALTASLPWALLFIASEARANPIVTRCSRLSPKQTSELEARAELTLSTLERQDGPVIVECDDLVSVLIWFDGSRRKIDEGNGLVEGALDAIEEQAGRGARERRSTARVTFDEPPKPAPPPPPPETPREPQEDEQTEGGIGLAMNFEPWSDRGVGVGPRLDVAIAIMPRLSFMLVEGARFGMGTDALAFDLQTGLGYGAPYGQRDGFGLVLLGGVERFAGRNQTLWYWVGTVAAGARAAARVGHVELWAGIDGVVRTPEELTSGPPNVSMQVAVGFFWSAWPFSLRHRP